MDALNVAAGWIHFVGLAGVLGSVAARWVLLGPSLPWPRADLAALRARVAHVGLAASGVLLTGLILVLVRQLVEFRDPFVPWAEDLSVLLSTDWGGIWRWAMAAAVILPVAFAGSLRLDRVGWAAAAGLTLVLAAFPALTGHAAAGDLRSWTLAADWLHVVAAGGWVGTLSVLLFLDRRAARRSAPSGHDDGAAEGPALLGALVARFSPLAMACVAALVGTGLFASAVQLGGVGRIWSTPYGRVLALKAALAASVLVLGAVNHRRWRPRLGDNRAREGLRQWAYWEVVLGAAVLAVTSVLVRTSPM